jgi:protein-tyrosine kinase
MSLIESALNKARKLAETSVQRPLESAQPPLPVAQARRKAPEPDAATIATRTAQARVLPASRVDMDAMERSGILLQPDSNSAHRAYRILRTRVQQRMQAQGWNSLGITASGVGEGKTVTAINLAIALARDVNTWVFLVDLDLQRPKVASYLGLEFGKGLSDYLAGNAEFDEILYNPGVERLTVVPNGQPMKLSSDALGSPRVREFCKSLAAEVPRHLVIFDLPPVLLSDDVLKFAPNLDCTLFVVSEGVTPRDVLQKAKEALHDMNLLGVVLNRSAENEKSAYY